MRVTGRRAGLTWVKWEEGPSLALLPCTLIQLGTMVQHLHWSLSQRGTAARPGLSLLRRPLAGASAPLLHGHLPGCCTGPLPLYPWRKASQSPPSSDRHSEMCNSPQGCQAGGQEGSDYVKSMTFLVSPKSEEKYIHRPTDQLHSTQQVLVGGPLPVSCVN